MIVLDKARALDLMISRSEQVRVPEPFSSGFWLVSVDSAKLAEGQLTNLLRPLIQAKATQVRHSAGISTELAASAANGQHEP